MSENAANVRSRCLASCMGMVLQQLNKSGDAVPDVRSPLR